MSEPVPAPVPASNPQGGKRLDVRQLLPPDAEFTAVSFESEADAAARREKAKAELVQRLWLEKATWVFVAVLITVVTSFSLGMWAATPSKGSRDLAEKLLTAIVAGLLGFLAGRGSAKG